MISIVIPVLNEAESLAELHGELSALARSRGGVIAHAYAHPSTLARLAAWVHRAADEGLRLVTVGEAITRSAANERDI